MMIADLKRKLRQLKKFEIRIRFGQTKSTIPRQYIWNEYFSTKDQNDPKVKYNMKSLLTFSRSRLQEIFDDYFYHVYFQYYKENGINIDNMYDVSLLAKLGLPPNSSMEDIKSKFRNLAKQHHPDLGGNSAKFMEIFDIYKKLTDE